MEIFSLQDHKNTKHYYIVDAAYETHSGTSTKWDLYSNVPFKRSKAKKRNVTLGPFQTILSPISDLTLCPLYALTSLCPLY